LEDAGRLITDPFGGFMTVLFIRALYYFLVILSTLIVVSALISWLPINHGNFFVRLLHTIIDPILIPIRTMIKKSIFGGANMALDFSPFIAYLILTTLQNYLRPYM
jgi:YggT family protein